MGSPVIQLRPACYSRSKKVEVLCHNIAIAPRQSPNSLEAIDGHVVDFHLADTDSSFAVPAYGTLAEFYQLFKPSQVIVHCTDGKVFIEVAADNDGPFFKIRGRTYNRQQAMAQAMAQTIARYKQ